MLDGLDGPRPLQAEGDPSARRQLGDGSYETPRRRARDLGVDAGVREAVVLTSGLTGWQLLDVSRRREEAAGGTPDRVLVERLVPARSDPGQAQRQERLERAAQLVLLRQLLGVQARELGRVRQQARLGSQHSVAPAVAFDDLLGRLAIGPRRVGGAHGGPRAEQRLAERVAHGQRALDGCDLLLRRGR